MKFLKFENNEDKIVVITNLCDIENFTVSISSWKKFKENI